MKKITCLILVISLIAGVIAYGQAKITVRGKVIELGSKDKKPLSAVAVTLNDTLLMNRTTPVYTSSDGMYYIYNVVPANYILEIWNSGLKAEPVKFQIKVSKSKNGYFDIAQIEVPRVIVSKTKLKN